MNETLLRYSGLGTLYSVLAREALERIAFMTPLDVGTRAIIGSRYREAARRNTVLDLKLIHAAAIEAATRPDIDLVYVHYPVPHPPGLMPEGNEGGPTGYAGNVLLVDRLVGELRAALADSGLSGNTALVLTSDHPFRDESWQNSAFLAPGEFEHLRGRSSGHVPIFIYDPSGKVAPESARWSVFGLVAAYFGLAAR